MKQVLVVLTFLVGAECMRLSAGTRCLPHMVQSASMVEISPRGIRIITASGAGPATEEECIPSNNSCACTAAGADGYMMYYPRTNAVRHFSPTLGPMAYTASIVCALASLYFFCENEKTATIAASATLASALCFVRVPFFPTPSDEVHFWASLAMTAFAAYCNENAEDVCMFALISLADAIYRTPETPYASIICLLLAIGLWRRAIVIIHDTAACGALQRFDFLSTMVYTAFTAETAMVPQFEHPEDWPLYGGAAVYVTFAIACMRHSRV
jgi:hypothetical protein